MSFIPTTMMPPVSVISINVIPTIVYELIPFGNAESTSDDRAATLHATPAAPAATPPASAASAAAPTAPAAPSQPEPQLSRSDHQSARPNVYPAAGNCAARRANVRGTHYHRVRRKYQRACTGRHDQEDFADSRSGGQLEAGVRVRLLRIRVSFG